MGSRWEADGQPIRQSASPALLCVTNSSLGGTGLRLTIAESPRKQAAAQILIKMTENRRNYGCFSFRSNASRCRRSAPVHKIVVVGSLCVGKTSLSLRFAYDEFEEGYESTKAESYTKKIELDQNEEIVDILDTAGREARETIRENYLRTAEGFLCVFSVTDRESLWGAGELREQILRVRRLCDDVPPLILVGNKSDLEDQRQVSASEARRLAERWNVPYIETSAKAKTNLDEAFYSLVRAIKRKKEERAAAPPAERKGKRSEGEAKKGKPGKGKAKKCLIM